jgi:hypothetical protein
MRRGSAQQQNGWWGAAGIAVLNSCAALDNSGASEGAPADVAGSLAAGGQTAGAAETLVNHVADSPRAAPPHAPAAAAGQQRELAGGAPAPATTTRSVSSDRDAALTPAPAEQDQEQLRSIVNKVFSGIAAQQLDALLSQRSGAAAAGALSAMRYSCCRTSGSAAPEDETDAEHLLSTLPSLRSKDEVLVELDTFVTTEQGVPVPMSSQAQAAEAQALQRHYNDMWSYRTIPCNDGAACAQQRTCIGYHSSEERRRCLTAIDAQGRNLLPSSTYDLRYQAKMCRSVASRE